MWSLQSRGRIEKSKVPCYLRKRGPLYVISTYVKCLIRQLRKRWPGFFYVTPPECNLALSSFSPQCPFLAVRSLLSRYCDIDKFIHSKMSEIALPIATALGLPILLSLL